MEFFEVNVSSDIMAEDCSKRCFWVFQPSECRNPACNCHSSGTPKGTNLKTKPNAIKAVPIQNNALKRL